ncbi:zinc-dependent metalloprotease [Polaribacter uvawellassae]|uniref:zinc-dependent metalloprotease n=1 Tax=Polaribacter uvawellassae TaxID=3133495 RepID=UPI0032197D30
MMKKYCKIYLLFFFFVSVSMFSQNIWTKQDSKSRVIGEELEYRETPPTSYELYTLNRIEVDNKLTISKNQETIMELPTPNGIQRFLVKEASVFSDELALKYPSIKSYVGVGIDDATARVRLSKSNVGFHAMITSGKYPMYLIDPYTKDKKTAIAYFKNKVVKSNFECLVEENVSKVHQKSFQKTTNANDGKLRTYRLAVVATGEYSQFHINNQNISATATDAEKKAAVLAAINTTMTRVNGIFERDLGVTMKLVSNNENIIFLDGVTDGLADDDADTLIGQTQALCDNTIGAPSYDIGHAFSTGGGSGAGLAGGGVVCLPGEKAQGVTGSASPINDTYDIDFVAHEMGHQFGANHTQNNDCNRYNATAVEPGSASSIMGYAGICDPNVQSNSDAYFHSVSIAEMWAIVTSTATCGVETPTNNNAPVANAGNDFSIPKSTPFVLKGAATDVDAGNNLTYNWEQIDNATATMPPVSTNTVGPMFRTLPSSTSPNRYMPVIATVLAGTTSSTWEVVPSVARSMSFSLTVRDNVLNGGATSRDDVKITVDGNSGPFVVTSQNTATTLNGNSTQTITWDVANTTASPVNAANVNILLSTDGGMTFPNVLISNTPNDGTEDVVITNSTTTQARIKVEAADHIFYAVNSTNFSIDKVASVNDELFTNFNLYPNPSKGIITVSFDLQSSDKVLVELFDIRGRKINGTVYEASGSTFTKTLNYQSVAKGLYILKIENGQNHISKKIVID